MTPTADSPSASAATTKYTVGFSGTAEITVKDDRVVLRITENRDDDERPEGDPEHRPERAYRSVLYDISTLDDVLNMLLWNAARNGVRNANRLDGWADLDDDAAVTEIQNIEVDWTDTETSTDE